MAKINQKLFQKAAGIKLDCGCGLNKQKGFLGMDMIKHPHVDIVHDMQKFPWPVPDNICSAILLSHVWEHIEPKYRFQLMDELWRIVRHDGQLMIVCPHQGSYLEAAHPAHYMCPNQGTFQFFDPECFFWNSCSYKKPLPWKIIRNDPNLVGTIEVVMEPRKDKKGKPIMPAGDKVRTDDVVKIELKETDGRKHNNNSKKREGRKPKK